ncbi:MAG TPA: HAMP domain-containing sensor histidine kinase [Bacteriovoracaceae bacterium]|nr:HAMP domain-containing sensor histidine kinase [Bacteriovoracaceae bacterium]
MENSLYPSNTEAPLDVRIYIQPEILSDFPTLDLRGFVLCTLAASKLSFQKQGERLWVIFPDGRHCDFPYYKKNISALLKFETAKDLAPPAADDAFEHFRRSAQSIEKKIFSSVSLSPGTNVKDLWDEIIKKVNAISNESHSLSGLVEKLLEVPFLQNFQTSIMILHLKGQIRAELIGTLWRTEKYKGLVEVKHFNTFFNTVRKSKIKSFSTDAFPKLNLPFNGSFLAKELTSKKFSLISIVSRHDFLAYNQEEIDLFETCIDLLQPHFERLIDQEFSDKQISEFRLCLKEFPLPIRIRDEDTGAAFLNDLYQTELQEKDIFFKKKISGPFVLDVYDSDDLQHYAFDLFHFQRISLLGELLNTLRHELSNPLFGLKLGAQIFSTLEMSAESLEFMSEIQKNINRSQAIIENFSNLYQVQSEKKPTTVKKMIDESLVLAKSELRGIRQHITYGVHSGEIVLDVPLIFVVQIIFNLLINAAQAMRNLEISKALFVVVAADADQVTIDVADNGPGIPAEMATQLFKPFFTTKSQGTGLGLILSRNLALKMGGNLEYLEDKTQTGARFRLTLPR